MLKKVSMTKDKFEEYSKKHFNSSPFGKFTINGREWNSYLIGIDNIEVISSGKSSFSSATIWKGSSFCFFVGAKTSAGLILASSERISSKEPFVTLNSPVEISV